MTQEKKATLSSLMKKQITAKPVKKAVNSDMQNNQEKAKTPEEVEADEALKEAKKESNSRAANYNQSEMLKKLLIENIVRYGTLVGVLVILAIAVIHSGPAIVKFFHGLISNIIFSAIR